MRDRQNLLHSQFKNSISRASVRVFLYFAARLTLQEGNTAVNSQTPVHVCSCSSFISTLASLKHMMLLIFLSVQRFTFHCVFISLVSVLKSSSFKKINEVRFWDHLKPRCSVDLSLVPSNSEVETTVMLLRKQFG